MKNIKYFLVILIIFFLGFISIDLKPLYTIKIGKYDLKTQTILSEIVKNDKYFFFISRTKNLSEDKLIDQSLHCYSIETGKQVWKTNIYKSPNLYFYDISIVDNILYVSGGGEKNILLLFSSKDGSFLKDLQKDLYKNTYYFKILKYDNELYFFGRLNKKEDDTTIIILSKKEMNDNWIHMEIINNNLINYIDTVINFDDNWFFFSNSSSDINGKNYEIKLYVLDNKFNIINDFFLTNDEYEDSLSYAELYKNKIYFAFDKIIFNNKLERLTSILFIGYIDENNNKKIIYKKELNDLGYTYDFDIINNKLYIPFSKYCNDDDEFEKYGGEESFLLVYDLVNYNYNEYRIGNYTLDYTMQLTFINDNDVLLKGETYIVDNDYIFDKATLLEADVLGDYHGFIVRINDIDKQLIK